MGISANVKRLVDATMAAENISRNELAARMGLNQPTLHRICTGETKYPRPEKLEKIARYFGITLDQLHAGEGVLPSSNANGVQHAVTSAPVAAELPRPSIETLDAVVAAVLASHGMTLDEYLAAKRPAQASAPQAAEREPGKVTWESPQKKGARAARSVAIGGTKK